MKRFIVARAVLVLLLVSFLLSVSDSAYALEKTGADGKGNYTVEDRREYPIIFIPGIAGSTLDTVDGGENAWPGSFSTEDLARLELSHGLIEIGVWQMMKWGLPGEIVNDVAFKALALDKNGKTPAKRDGGKELKATGTVKYGAGDIHPIVGPIVTAAVKLAVTAVPAVGQVLGSHIPVTADWRVSAIYQGFYDYMEKEGYKLNQNPSGTGKVFFDFPYDFRQDNGRWTESLDKKVDAVLNQTKSDKVILVGHSMGGLQARLYMKDPKRAAKVAAVVFMGTPHHGSPMPFFAMTEGYNFGNAKLTNARMWEIAGNWEGGYQLLPDFAFILDGDDRSKPAVGLEAMLHENWISTQAYEHYLQARKTGEKYDIPIGFPNNEFARKSVDFHKKLGDSVDKYPGVKYYMIRGTDQDTAEFLVAHWERVEGLPEPLIRFTKEMSQGKKGDGTVPLSGALINGVEDELYEVKSAHGDIPSNAAAQNTLTDIRKKTNNEDFRNAMVDKMSKFTKENIANAKSPGFNIADYTNKPGVSFGEIIWLWLTGPDKEKIKLRDEIRNMALPELRNARANVTIEKDELGRDNPEHLYMVIDDYQLKDAGTGIVSGETVKITVDSYDTFEQVLGNRKSLTEAYRTGKVKFVGAGVSNRLKSKLAEWISKYFMKN